MRCLVCGSRVEEEFSRFCEECEEDGFSEADCQEQINCTSDADNGL